MNVPKDEKTNKEIAEDIVKLALRSLAMEYPFLERALYMPRMKASDEIASVCADYKYLYYNEKFVIENFKGNFRKVKLGILHCILHCLYLHPSLKYEDRQLFDASADMAVLNLMGMSGDLKYNVKNSVDDFLSDLKDKGTSEIYKAAANDPKVKAKLFKITQNNIFDDHSLWYKNDNESKTQNQIALNNSGSTDQNMGTDKCISFQRFEKDDQNSEDEWRELLKYSMNLCRSEHFGTAHGNMFANIEKPDRFSKFSYKEYLRRFAKRELNEEDPETLDLMLYTLGMEIYKDMPLIEFSEVRESNCVNDIIIAIDMSGSCSGDIASNFLRQLYTLFEEMDIQNRINLKVITFDTEILDEFTIKCGNDADKLINNYNPHGFGGTNFNCIFNYANTYSKKNKGRKLKALFAFSDACGLFPQQNPTYKTTFFVPEPVFTIDYYGVPRWVELVHYTD